MSDGRWIGFRGLAICAATVLLLGSTTSAQNYREEVPRLLKQFDADMDAERYREAEASARRLLEIYRANWPNASANIARCLECLGRAYHGQKRDDEALGAYQQALGLIESASGPDSAEAATLHYRCGSSYEALRRYAEAEASYRRAMEMRQRVLGRDSPHVAQVAGGLASMYYDLKRYAEAAEMYGRAVEIRTAQYGPESLRVATLLSNQALAYNNLGRYAEAEPLYRRAMAIEQRLLGENDPQRVSVIRSLGLLYKNQARYAEAETLLKLALEIRQRALGERHARTIDTMNDLGGLYLTTTRCGDASAVLSRAKTLLEAMPSPDQATLSSTLTLLASLYTVLGRFQDAEPLYQQSLQIDRRLYGDESRNVATDWNNLACLYEDLERLTDAESLHLRVLDLRQRLFGPDHPDVAVTLNNLGVVYGKMGRKADAASCYRRAVLIREKAQGPEHPQVAQIVCNLAIIYREQFQYSEAEPLFHRALAIQEKVMGRDHASVAETLTGLAGSYQLQGRDAEAVPVLERALAIFRKTFGPNHRSEQAALRVLGHAYRNSRRFAEAEAAFQKNLAFAESLRGPESVMFATACLNLGRCYADQKRYAEAEPLLDRAAEIMLRRNAEPETLLRVYSVRAIMDWDAGRRSQAVEEMEKALTLVETRRSGLAGAEQEQASYFGATESFFTKMFCWRNELGDVAGAHRALERARARALLDQFALAGVDLLHGLPSDQAQTLRQRQTQSQTLVAGLQKQIAAVDRDTSIGPAERAERQKRLEAELASAQQAAADAYRDVRNASPAFRAIAGQNREPVPLAELTQWVAQSGGILLQYVVRSKESFVFIVPGDASAPRAVSLALDEDQARALGVDAGPLTAKTLDAVLRIQGAPLTRLLADPEQDARVAGRLAALWQVLVPEPERKRLVGGKVARLYVIPDGPLVNLPLESLVVSGGEKEKRQYLLDAGPPVVYAPSATVLLGLARRPAEKASETKGTGREPVLTVGEPQYAAPGSQDNANLAAQLTARSRYGAVGGSLKPLPYTGWETGWVQSVFAENNLPAAQLKGPQATEAAVRGGAPGRRVLHLACHGLVDQSHGNLFGALALTPGAHAEDPADDGFLTLAEIYQLDLKGCELAILSACDTNYGPQQRGEGVWALSRGFLVSGSRRVVASNWLVDDESAASLISYFCSLVAQAEKEGKTPDYAKALHDAKRWICRQEKWKSPYYWGTFVLVGPN